MSNPKTKKLQITISTKTVEELENMKKEGDKNEAKEVFLQRS